MSLSIAIEALTYSVNALRASILNLLNKPINTISAGAGTYGAIKAYEGSSDIKTLSTMTKGIFDVVNKNTAGIGSLTEDMRLVALDTEIIRRIFPKPETSLF